MGKYIVRITHTHEVVVDARNAEEAKKVFEASHKTAK